MRQPTRRTFLALSLTLFTLIGAAAAVRAQQPPADRPPDVAKPALDPAAFAFLAGRWVGTSEGAPVEEHWSPVALGTDGRPGNNIMGMFRWCKADGAAALFELLTITAEDDAVYLRLRHFSGTLEPWASESNTPRLTLDRAASSPTRAVFNAADGSGGKLAAVEYAADGADGLSITIRFVAESAREPLTFKLKRA